MWGSGVRKKLTLLMALVFLINAVIPSLTLAAAAAPVSSSGLEEDSALQELLGGRVLICTPEGVKLVSWAELQGQQKEPATDAETGCALCNLPVFGTTVAAISLDNGAPIIFHPVEKNPYAYADGTFTVSLIPSRNFLTRAPPLLLT